MLLVGAIFVVHGRYTFSKMLQVFSLIMFTVTFAGQLMNYRKSRAGYLSRTPPDHLRPEQCPPWPSRCRPRTTSSACWT